jgi:hypothetical protein
MFIIAVSLVSRLVKLVPKSLDIGTKTYILGIDVDALLYIKILYYHVPTLERTSDLRMLRGNSAIAIHSDICLARQTSCNYGTTTMAVYLYN